MKNNIALIGMMGSGKSTVAEELAKIMADYSLVDIDCEIEKSTGKKISELFLKFGEQHFRMLESEKIKKISAGTKQIIALGGGAFESENNRNIVNKNCSVIYLKATSEEIYNRIKSEVHRPLLHKNFSVERISEIMQKREKNYQKADFSIITNNKSPKEIAAEIAGVLNDKS